jgi:hypothetical protein
VHGVLEHIDWEQTQFQSRQAVMITPGSRAIVQSRMKPPMPTIGS